jgi:hypothetical protein
MNILFKTVAASLMLANSAFAAQYFIGGSFGFNSNNVKVKATEKGELVDDVKSAKGSNLFSLEAGAVYYINQKVAISSAVFGDFNSFQESISNLNLNQNFTIGINSNLIGMVGNSTKVYGGVGIGFTNLSAENNVNRSTDTSSFAFFTRLTLGTEYKLDEKINLFAEMFYDLPIAKTEQNLPNNSKFSYKHVNSGLKVGVRYFF